MKPMSLQQIARAIGARYTGEDRMIPHISTDSRTIQPGCLFVALKGDRFDGHAYIATALEQGAVCAVSMEDGPYPPDKVLGVSDTRQALMQIAGLYRRSLDVRVVGITGSVGKTTTKEMVACVLAAGLPTLKTQANLNNEVGLSQTILQLEESHKAAVLEMGMDGPGQMHHLSLCAAPDIGILTNIGVSHIQQFGSREGIREEKLAISDGMWDGAVLIVCGDDDMLATVDIPRLQVLRYAIDAKEAQVRAERIKEYSTHTNFEILYNGNRFDAQIPTVGRHNVYNALAAFLAGVTLNIQPQVAVAALKNYRPAGMRQNVVHHAEFTVVEDCYNASPDSMRAALTTLGRLECDGRRIAVLSDMLELGEIAQQAHYQVGHLVGECGVDALFCTGPLSKEYVHGAQDAGLEQAVHYQSMDTLFEALKTQIHPGDILWFKASRSMKLEQVIERVYKTF